MTDRARHVAAKAGHSATMRRTETSVFTETGVFLTEPALKAFAAGMKNVKPTENLVAAMSHAKTIRRG